ncbi:hypothetical protein BDK92_7252 [Micromonospora pisi]|uniref:Uncharacterized protein n=1 Tax=Micromonospora pisi TaxID=589240 RepID=A0A495JWP2_9ACTN|nr:hypothetical protein [Micromonospora pisi]RKR92772.1 hypothetical protein BDK92_7252 [Micromonospora pisi]
MPRVSIPVTEVTRAGIAPAAETNGNATDNHVVANNGKVILLVRNSNGAATARTVTVRFARDVDGQAVTPRTYEIPAAASRYIGPFDQATYGAQMQVDVDHADLKLSAYRLP